MPDEVKSDKHGVGRRIKFKLGVPMVGGADTVGAEFFLDSFDSIHFHIYVPVVNGKHG